MELSAIELRHIVDSIKGYIVSGYYVSNVSAVTTDSFLFRLHHTTEPEILLIISVIGIWITKFKFKPIEQNIFVNTMKTEIERARVESISQLDGERIVSFKFRYLDGISRILIVELFGGGNIILCNENMQIISLLHNVEVRHRTLKAGLRYIQPPSRGIDIFDVSVEKLKKMRDLAKGTDLDILRWMGRNLSISKKFVEEIAIRANILEKKPQNLSDEDIVKLYNVIKDLIMDVSTGKNQQPLIAIDENGKPLEVFAIKTHQVAKLKTKNAYSYMDALDEVFSSALIDRGLNTKTDEIAKQIRILEHDLIEQNKAKDEVIGKANKIRKLASELMLLSYRGLNDLNSDPIKRLLSENSALIVTEKGLDYLEIVSERIPFEFNLPRMASLLFVRAKEMERGNQSIDQAKSKLLSNIDKLRKQTYSIVEDVEIKRNSVKEWYERYRWFVTSDGLLAIGGRDASSNSAIIRKHMTEKDIVFHAEIHGSPFFIIKNGNIVGDGPEFIKTSLREVAQATVSFSRAWKDGLSSADAYWVMPEQIKKGAPTGQFLPKGSFVVEGKRNYIKDIEIKLSIGIMRLTNRYTIGCGPTEVIKKRSIVYAILLPGGTDPMDSAKRLKGELFKAAATITGNTDVTEYIKKMVIDDLIRSLPPGKSKISFSGLGQDELV